MTLLLIILGIRFSLLTALAQGFSDFGEEADRTAMSYVLPLIGIIFAFLLVKYRERIGDMIGEAHWMKKIGGVYYVLVYTAIIIFFWSLASLTDTTNIFLAPLEFLIPFARDQKDF